MMKQPSLLFTLVLFALTLGQVSAAQADEVVVAVAANFLAPLQEISAEFTKDTQHTASLTAGSTGKMFAQIQNGAPFEVMVSADRKTPNKLIEAKLAVAASQFTYARGKLVLWSADPALVDAKGDVLKTGHFNHLAIANPKTAAYGEAAVELMAKLGLSATLQPKLVQGENIAQTKMFVDSGGAELGFVALSQVFKGGKISKGSAWEVPLDLYAPIYQDAVLLKKGASNPAASALLAYLKSDKAKAIMAKYGYIH